MSSVGLLAYMKSGAILSALFENWESEFLQMSAYVVLTAMLFQRGSAESRDPDNPERADDEVSTIARKYGAAIAWLYSYSLGIALAVLFVISFGDDVPPRGVACGIDRRAVRHCRVDQRATAGRLMRGSSLNWPTLSSVM